MKGFDFITKRYSMPISKKYTAAQLNAHVGRNAGLIFVMVPLEWVKGGNTPGNRLQVKNRIGPLFGDTVCCRVGEVGKTSKPTGVISLLIQKLHAEGATRLTRGFLRLTGADGESKRRGIAVHEKHSLETSTFSQPKTDTSVILRGTYLLTEQEETLSKGVTGAKEWGSFRVMKQEVENAIVKHLGALYDAEETPTSVDMSTGKVEEEGGGMPIKEYWEKWKTREQTWTHDDVLPSITLDAQGGETCSFNKRKPCKVRSRTYVTQRIMNWLQVNGRKTAFAIRIRFPYAMREVMRAACREIEEKFGTAEIRTFRYVWPTKAIEWIRTGIPADEEGHVSLKLKAARRLVKKKKKENTWGAEQEMKERSIVDATAAAEFVYMKTGLDVVAVKAKMIDMEVLGVSGQVALYELIVAKGDLNAMSKITGPAMRNEYTHLDYWPMETNQRRGKPPIKAPFEVKENEVWKVGGQLAVQARAGASLVEEEVEEESLEQMMQKEQRQAYREAMTQARDRSDLGSKASAVAEEMFTLKEEEEVHAASKKLNAMRERKRIRIEDEAREEEEEAAKGAGQKKESTAPRDKWGGKLRMIVHAHGSTDQVSKNCEGENEEEERKRISLEGAAAIRASSAAELRFRLEAGKRLTAEKRTREQKRANELTTDQERVQILVKPGDIRPTKDTTTKTLRALAIHMIEEGLAGPYAGLDPEEVRTAAEPGTMLPVRVEFTIGKEVIPAHTQRGGKYPLQQVWEAQRAEGDLNKQLSTYH